MYYETHCPPHRPAVPRIITIFFPNSGRVSSEDKQRIHLRQTYFQYEDIFMNLNCPTSERAREWSERAKRVSEVSVL